MTYPLDTIKTLEQANSSEKSGRMSAGTSALSWTDYLRGLGPTIVAAIPANAIFFIVYNYLGILISQNASPHHFENSSVFSSPLHQTLHRIAMYLTLFRLYGRCETCLYCINLKKMKFTNDIVECDMHVFSLFQRLVIAFLATLPQNAVKIPAEILKQRSQVQDQFSSLQIFNR